MVNTLGIINKHKHLGTLAYNAGRVGFALAFALSLVGGVVQAAPLAATAPGLGAAAAFSAFGKAGVTDDIPAGGSDLSGVVGANLLASITGFPPGIAGGGIVAAGPGAGTAEGDAGVAFGALAAQGPGTPEPNDLTGLSLGPGVYSVPGVSLLPGVLTLSGAGVYVFLTDGLTASGSVSLTNGATACNVFWHDASSVSITGGSFVGTIIALTSITFGNGASLDGRALALNGNVTLINNSIFGPSCAAAAGSGPSYVSVTYVCADDGGVVVSVGFSGGVVVSGLGGDITQEADTGDNKIVRSLPAGQYTWHATPKEGHFMIDTADGVVDSTACGPAAIAAASVTAGAPSATAEGPVLIPNTGADLTAQPWIPVGLGLLSLGLVLLGLALRRKRSAA